MLSPDNRKIVGSEEVLKIREEKNRLDFGYDLIPYLVDKGLPIYGYEIRTWYDVGSPERYLKAMHDILYVKLELGVSEKRIFANSNVWIQGYSEASIKRREEILRKHNENKLGVEGAVLIGRHTIIGDNSKISD